MRIIRHGVEYKFECPNCDCMWVMSRRDLQDEQQNLVFVSVSNCPDCGTTVNGSTIKYGDKNVKDE